MVAVWIIGALVVLALAFLIATYNELVRLKNNVKNQWAQVDVALKRRRDLIPNLVSVVKGYAVHETQTLQQIAEMRAMQFTPQNEPEARKQLNESVVKLFAIAEKYPELKANTNFLELQGELKSSEDMIATARQFYNDTVMLYVRKLKMFPSNIVANIFGFKPDGYFTISDEDRETPDVKL